MSSKGELKGDDVRQVADFFEMIRLLAALLCFCTRVGVSGCVALKWL